jgi:hypothetical protein
MGCSLYLSAPPRFLYGAARLLDFGNTFDAYNRVGTADSADVVGALIDWETVGQDLWTSVRKCDQETNAQRKNDPEEAQLVSR